MAEPTQDSTFDMGTLLNSMGCPSSVATYRQGDPIFFQGDPCDTVMYIQSGSVRLSVVSGTGREAVPGMLTAGSFLGEEALSPGATRRETATAATATTVRVIVNRQMIRLLHAEPALSDLFIADMLSRNVRLKADLVDQLINSTEKRLARMLVLLAGDGEDARRVSPDISQTILAEMVGTTRSRVNMYLNRFKRSGFISYDRGIRIRNSLQRVLMHD